MSQTINEGTHVYTYHNSDGERVPKDTNNVTIHHSVTHIPDIAFYQCTELETIKLHKGVTSIGYSAFKGCVMLTHTSTFTNHPLK